VLTNHENFRRDLSLLENHDVSLTEARAAVEITLNRLTQQARKLSAVRARKAKDFSQAVVRELSGLHMDRARFQATISTLEEPNASGLDLLRFEIAANPGEPMGPMNKVASGGELSRIMLAMHNVVSSRSGVGVFLFDEVDAGIGGAVAVAVGAKLRSVAAHNQVICITHLPQVAAFGHSHYRVDKSVVKKGREERTICSVVGLGSAGDRESEIARMLGGLGNHQAALLNARAMLELAAGKASKKAATKIVPPAPAKKPVSRARAS
jgi:DNA repair protein RecN (Recombination protein N)